jgi:hypothetical protein
MRDRWDSPKAGLGDALGIGSRPRAGRVEICRIESAEEPRPAIEAGARP